jgi:hypothetical protein
MLPAAVQQQQQQQRVGLAAWQCAKWSCCSGSCRGCPSAVQLCLAAAATLWEMTEQVRPVKPAGLCMSARTQTQQRCCAVALLLCSGAVSASFSKNAAPVALGAGAWDYTPCLTSMLFCTPRPLPSAAA